MGCLDADESKQSLLSCLLDSIQQEYSLCRSDPSDQHIQVSFHCSDYDKMYGLS